MKALWGGRTTERKIDGSIVLRTFAASVSCVDNQNMTSNETIPGSSAKRANNGTAMRKNNLILNTISTFTNEYYCWNTYYSSEVQFKWKWPISTNKPSYDYMLSIKESIQEMNFRFVHSCHGEGDMSRYPLFAFIKIRQNYIIKKL